MAGEGYRTLLPWGPSISHLSAVVSLDLIRPIAEGQSPLYRNSSFRPHNLGDGGPAGSSGRAQNVMKGLGTHVSTYSLIAGVQKGMTDRRNTACLGKKCSTAIIYLFMERAKYFMNITSKGNFKPDW